MEVWFVGFNGTSIRRVLFYTKGFGNHVHFTFITYRWDPNRHHQASLYVYMVVFTQPSSQKQDVTQSQSYVE